MKSRLALNISVGISIFAFSTANAAETVTHEYDALGRLKKSVKQGGPVSGSQNDTTFDPAGNRINQVTTGAPPPPPPPSPPPAL